jgi:hypothetical protein
MRTTAGEAQPNVKGPGGMKILCRLSYPKPLPVIDGGASVALDKVTDQAWAAVIRGNSTPKLFRFSGGLVRLEDDEHGGPLLTELTTARMIHELALCAKWMKRGRGGEMVPARPHRDVAVNLLATPHPPLLVLERIYRVPVFGRDGHLHSEPGYSPSTRGLYVPLPILDETLEICHEPDEETIAAARAVLLDDVLGDFPFLDESDRAHALSLLLLPFLRALILGPTPLHLFSKPTPRTGASLWSRHAPFPSWATWCQS